MTTDEAPSSFRLILSELPRRRGALVLLIVVLNVVVVVLIRGRVISDQRLSSGFGPLTIRNKICPGPYINPRTREVVSCSFGGPPGFVPLREGMERSVIPPWEWTVDEWRETLPWR